MIEGRGKTTAAKRKSKFIQIVVSRHPDPDADIECLFALDDEGEVWWRDVSSSCSDSEPWTKMNSKRTTETLHEALGGKLRRRRKKK